MVWLLVSSCVLFAGAIAEAGVDPRSYQHGIDFVPLPDGNAWLFWSSSGNPPTGALPDGSWPHDVYRALIHAADPRITPTTLISNPEAQEPASAAIAADGRIMVTMEDGWNTDNGVAQRFGIYDAQLNPVAPYPRMVFDGGHSGHVAAVGNRFVVFFGDEWVDGGGVDDLGTGDDVRAKVYQSNGLAVRNVAVAVGPTTRDWWPVVAGSSTQAFLLWQRFVDGEVFARLLFSVLDPMTGGLSPHAVPLEEKIRYYTYNVEYISSIDRFLVLGTYQTGGGFGYLLDASGNVTAQNTSLPAIVRESQSAVHELSGGAVVVHPIAPAGVMILSLSDAAIVLDRTIDDPYVWQSPGTDGIFLDADTVYFVSLSTSGLVTKTFQLASDEPEAPAIGIWGLWGVVVTLLTVGAIIVRQRRRQPMTGVRATLLLLFVWATILLWSPAATRAADADDCNRIQPAYPGKAWAIAEPAAAGMDQDVLREARDYALTGGGSGYITRGGKLVMAWGDPRKRYDLKSTTKSIGVTALGLAIADGKLALHDRAGMHHPQFGIPPEQNRETGWLDEITIFHLVTQTAGFDKPGGYERLLFKPGTKWCYSDGGPNWLAECITLAYGQDLRRLMFDRVFSPLGIGPGDLTWRTNDYRPAEINGVPRREFGSGISANVDAMARIGYLYLRRGRWRGRQIIPASFVDAVRTVPPAVRGLPVVRAAEYFNASDHYGLLWWNNAAGTLANVPKDAYWSWGLYDSLIVVIPSLDIVASRAGHSLNKARNADYQALAPFLEPIATSVTGATRPAPSPSSSAPCPPSPVIERLTWAAKKTIVRRAEGSDNWPITWGDDDVLYTAYGDGWGFAPKLKSKLSLGFARILGGPEDITAINIRSKTGEQIGDGPRGKKASGLLMVDGTLYMWARNAGNAQLAWSVDHGRTWRWSDWRFTTSFGCPTFLNFGRNDAGARDAFVYVYSSDSDSAYEPADHMVLARVPQDGVRRRDAYVFFQGLDAVGDPIWTDDIAQRGAVFTHPGRCSRSGVSYNAGLKRYLWCQTLPASRDPRGPRFQGGFGVYDAPEPWGPWTTVFFTETWDVGPGESSVFPTKWMSDDGMIMYLVFSGDDSFSIRRADVRLRRAETPRTDGK